MQDWPRAEAGRIRELLKLAYELPAPEEFAGLTPAQAVELRATLARATHVDTQQGTAANPWLEYLDRSSRMSDEASHGADQLVEFRERLEELSLGLETKLRGVHRRLDEKAPYTAFNFALGLSELDSHLDDVKSCVELIVACADIVEMHLASAIQDLKDANALLGSTLAKDVEGWQDLAAKLSLASKNSGYERRPAGTGSVALGKRLQMNTNRTQIVAMRLESILRFHDLPSQSPWVPRVSGRADAIRAACKRLNSALDLPRQAAGEIAGLALSRNMNNVDPPARLILHTKRDLFAAIEEAERLQKAVARSAGDFRAAVPAVKTLSQRQIDMAETSGRMQEVAQTTDALVHDLADLAEILDGAPASAAHHAVRCRNEAERLIAMRLGVPLLSTADPDTAAATLASIRRAGFALVYGEKALDSLHSWRASATEAGRRHVDDVLASVEIARPFSDGSLPPLESTGPVNARGSTEWGLNF